MHKEKSRASSAGINGWINGLLYHWSCSGKGMMEGWKRYAGASALLGLLLSAAGCKKSAPDTATSATSTNSVPSTLNSQLSTNAQPSTFLRLHWVGIKQLSAQTNAAQFLSLWNLPESVRLRDQTLDKLAEFLAKEKGGSTSNAMTTNGVRLLTSAATRLRPLLEDLVQDEAYVEVRGQDSGTKRQESGADEFAIAVKLDEARAGMWATNLAQETGDRSQESGGGLTVTRKGEWTVVSLAPRNSSLASDVASRVPSASLGTNWLELELNPPARSQDPGAARAPMPSSLTLALEGVNGWVYERGHIDFDQPLAMNLDRWTVPTDLIAGEISSFTALRGVEPWLALLESRLGLQFGSVPNQLYFWALKGTAPSTFFAAPAADASNQVAQITDWVMEKGKPIFATNNLVKFERASTYNGLRWRGLPDAAPFLQSSFAAGVTNFVSGGMFPVTGPAVGLPIEIGKVMQGQTNLVAYDLELTGQRIEQWFRMGQFIRLVAYRAQLPANSAGLKWLRALEPKLFQCVTEVTQTGPAQLTFKRNSNIGLTAIEMHLLVDWLESPDFPRGLHSCLPVEQ